MTRNNKKSRNSKSKDKSEWICKKCRMSFTDDSDKIMQCSGSCSNYYCAHCINLSDEQYEVFQRQDCFWFCKPCLSTFNPTAGHTDGGKFCDVEIKLGKLEEKLDLFIAQNEEENLAKSFANVLKTNLNDKVIHKSDENLSKIIKESVNEQQKEFSARESREKNVIIYGINDSNMTSGSGINDSTIDKQFFDDLCKMALKIEIPCVEKITRLGNGKFRGKKNDGIDNSASAVITSPRPLKVCFGTKSDKAVFMQNLYSLKNAEPKFRNIQVRKDLSIEERRILKKEIEKAKNSMDPNVKYRLKITGPPENPKVHTQIIQ